MIRKSIFILIFLCLFCPSIQAVGFTASYYTVKSCRAESGQSTMANGHVLRDNALIAASWDFPFGTRLRVKNLRNGKSTVVTVTDRGPARRLYQKGRVLDLSVAAFRSIANIREGVIPIEFTEVK